MLRPPGGQERKLSGIARPASQGIPRPGQSRLQARDSFKGWFCFCFLISSVGHQTAIHPNFISNVIVNLKKDTIELFSVKVSKRIYI